MRAYSIMGSPPLNLQSNAVIAAALIIALCACASAPQRGNGPPPGGGLKGDAQSMRRVTIDGLMFAGFDADRDGQVAFGEIEAGLDAAMVRADADLNNALSGLELRALGLNEGGDASAAPIIGVLDPDGDNVARFADVARWAMARARTLDANGDQKLQRSELWENVAIRGAGPGRGEAGEKGQRPPPKR